MRTKYPKTWHLPWSESESSDDHWLTACRHFEGREVVCTEKLDGENTSLYRDYIHARSLDSVSHPCRTRIRATWGKTRHEIPAGWRVCGENLEAAHSIWYLDLDGDRNPLFYCFGIYDAGNACLSWSETETYGELLGFHLPPVVHRGTWDEGLIRSLGTGPGSSRFRTVQVPADHRVPPRPWRHYRDPFGDGADLDLPMPPTGAEGYVVRLADAFPFGEFERSVAKFVRRNHVQTSEFWLNLPVLPNLTRNPKPD